MKKINIKLVVLLIVLIIGASVAVNAANYGKAQIRIFLDGVDITPTQSDVIIIDGRAYAPVRELAPSLGYYVTWDGKERIINLSSTYDVEAIPPWEELH